MSIDYDDFGSTTDNGRLISPVAGFDDVVNDYKKMQELSAKLEQIYIELEELLSEWQRLGEICML